MKLALSFLGGAIFSAAAVILAGGRPANMLWLGAALALTTFGAVVYLAGLRRVARFLNAFMDAAEGVQPKAKQSRTERPAVAPALEKYLNPRARPVIDRSNPMGYVKPSKKQQEQAIAELRSLTMKRRSPRLGVGSVKRMARSLSWKAMAADPADQPVENAVAP